MDDRLNPQFLPSNITRARFKARNFRWVLEHYSDVLDERQRDIVVRWIGLDGLAYDAPVLAEEYGVSIAMIRKVFARACKSLSRAIQEAEEPPLDPIPPQPLPPRKYTAGGRKPYLTDLSDEQWNVIAHLLPDVKPERGGLRSVDYREVVNTLRYKARTGCPWVLLPHDLPPVTVVHYYYRRWQRDGTLERIEELLAKE